MHLSPSVQFSIETYYPPPPPNLGTQTHAWLMFKSVWESAKSFHTRDVSHPYNDSQGTQRKSGTLSRVKMEKLTQKLSGCKLLVAGPKHPCPWRVALEGGPMVWGLLIGFYFFGKFDSSWSHMGRGELC